MTSDDKTKTGSGPRAWIIASVVTALAAVAAGFLGTKYYVEQTSYYVDETNSQWIPYSPAKLTNLRGKGHVVLVSCQADWDLQSHKNKTIVEGPKIRQWLQSNNAIAMLADCTEESPETEKLLQSLSHGVVPVVAVYTSDTTEEPFVLLGAAPESDILDALERCLSGSGPVPAARNEPGRHYRLDERMSLIPPDGWEELKVMPGVVAFRGPPEDGFSPNFNVMRIVADPNDFLTEERAPAATRLPVDSAAGYDACKIRRTGMKGRPAVIYFLSEPGLIAMTTCTVGKSDTRDWTGVFDEVARSFRFE